MKGLIRLAVVLSALAAYIGVRSMIYGQLMGCDAMDWWVKEHGSSDCTIILWWLSWFIAMPVYLLIIMIIGGLVGAVLWIAEGFEQ